MKIKCENVVRCGNYNCCHNTDGYYCAKAVVALDTSGKCAFVRPKTSPGVEKAKANAAAMNSGGSLEY